MVTLSLNKGEKRELVYVNEPHLELHITQSEGSVLRLFVINMGADDNAELSADIQVDHVEEGCLTQVYALNYLQHEMRAQLKTNINHQVGGGKSEQLLKFVLLDEAKADFLGALHIAKDAQKVDASQTNRNLLLSPKALIHTRPQLEIYADDVKASHGASTGQLDEQALFYMQQRGIDRTTAERMLVAAFLREVLDALEDDTLKEQLINTMDGIVQ